MNFSEIFTKIYEIWADIVIECPEFKCEDNFDQRAHTHA